MPTGTEIQPQPGRPTPRRGWGAFTRAEHAAIVAVLSIVLAGGIVAGIVTTGDHGSTALASSTTSTSATTSTTAPLITTSTSSTTTTIGADLLSQLRAALRGTDAEGVVTSVKANILHNLQVGTSLATTAQAQAVAVEVCTAGKALGYTDVRVRAANGHTLVSTGVFDNDCQRR